MSLDDDSTKLGRNAIARAYNLFSFVPDLLKSVRSQTSSPGWELGRLVAECEKLIVHAHDDMAVPEALHKAMGARGSA